MGNSVNSRGKEGSQSFTSFVWPTNRQCWKSAFSDVTKGTYTSVRLAEGPTTLECSQKAKTEIFECKSGRLFCFWIINWVRLNKSEVENLKMGKLWTLCFVGKSYWTPAAFVMHCIVLRISLKPPSVVYFSAATRTSQNWMSQHDDVPTHPEYRRVFLILSYY